MGFELDRIMKQYGVNTPTLSYAGLAKPVAPTDTTLDQTKYNNAMTQYTSDQDKYNAYKANYQSRMANTPMYAGAQFQTTPKPAAGSINDLYNMYLGRNPEAGIDLSQSMASRGGSEQFIKDAQAELNTRPGYGNQNLMNATGSYYGNQLQNPMYSPMAMAQAAQAAQATPEAQAAQAAKVAQAAQVAQANAVPSYDPNETRLDYTGFAHGGAVKTHFQSGGMNALGNENGMADAYGIPPPMEYGMSSQDGPAIKQLLIPPPPSGRAMPPGLTDMMSKYQGEGVYGPELKLARETSTRENEAFNKLLQDAILAKTDNAPSKAEMYFRLASAFGAPTRTGSFSENLSNVGKTLGEYAKETREAEKAGLAGKLALGIEAQRSKMAGAKEDLTTLRGLASEEMKDKRAVASKMMEEYIKSGQPQSSAGKQAVDEGLAQGTPAFQKRVSIIAEQNIEKQSALINATIASMGASQAAASLAQQKFGFQKEQSTKLTSPELKLKADTEDIVAQTGQALDNLKTAYRLNPNTFDTSTVDTVQRKLLEASGSKAPKLQNTREMENLLEKAALSQLKATFPGAISNDERVALMATQGLSAKSIEERGKIMRNAFTALQTVEARSKKRLNEINQGLYRSTESSGSLD